MTHNFSKYLVPAVLLFVLVSPVLVQASQIDGTIDGTFKYAWSDKTGWINFGTTNGNLHITDAGLSGFAWSSNTGWVNMNPTNGGVTNNGEGVLGGLAWGEGLGYINFSGVTIDRATGHFHGVASGTNVGTLTFDCTNCAVVTDWRSASFRAAAANGGGGGAGAGGGGGTGGSSGGGGGGNGPIPGTFSVGGGNNAGGSGGGPVPGLPSTGGVFSNSLTSGISGTGSGTVGPRSPAFGNISNQNGYVKTLAAAASVGSSTARGDQNLFDIGLSFSSAQANHPWLLWGLLFILFCLLVLCVVILLTYRKRKSNSL